MKENELKLDGQSSFESSFPSLTVGFESGDWPLSPDPDEDIYMPKSISESLRMKERTCEVCGAPLTKRQISCRNRFCSRQCYAKWMSVNLRGKNHPLYKPEVHERYCEVCGDVLNTGKRFCSHRCHGMWARGSNNPWYKPEIHERPCEVCGKPRPVQNQRFCSRECMSKGTRGENSHNWRPELHMGSCEMCGNPLTEVCQTRFCSKKCTGRWVSLTYRGKNHPRWVQQELNCDHCGEPISRPPSNIRELIFCNPECAGKYMTGEGSPAWRGGVSFEPYGLEFNHSLREAVRNRDNRECQYCGISESNANRKLDVHHINYDKGDNREENLISLCNPCHMKSNFRRYFWEAMFRMRIQEKDSIQSRLHIIQGVKK